MCLHAGPTLAQEPPCVTVEQLNQLRARVVELNESHLADLSKFVTATRRQLAALDAYRDCRAKSIWCSTAEKEVELAKEEAALINRILITTEMAVTTALNIYKLAESARCQQ